jgi:hypothetical protein
MDSGLALIVGAILALAVFDILALLLGIDSRDRTGRHNWW